MSDSKVKAAAAVINECKARGYYDKPMPVKDGDIVMLGEQLLTRAEAALENGSTKPDVEAIVSVGKLFRSADTPDDPDEARYAGLIMEEIDGLPNPFQPVEEEVLPYDLSTLTVKEIIHYIGVYNSCFGYANHKYSLEEAGSAAAKIIADEAYDEWLVGAVKKDPETNKPKTARQLEAEASVQDERVKKWRTKQKEHLTRAKRYKRLKDIYFENCERLSRAFTAIQDERKYTNGQLRKRNNSSRKERTHYWQFNCHTHIRYPNADRLTRISNLVQPIHLGSGFLMTKQLTPENYERHYKWDQLDYEVRAKTIQVLGDRLGRDLSESIYTQMTEDQDWWKNITPKEFKNEVITFLIDEVPEVIWDDYWIAALEKSAERVIEDV